MIKNVHVFNIGVICIHGKGFLRQLAFHQDYKRSHNETKFDTSAKLVSEQDEIYGVKTINCLGKLFMEAFVFDW